MLKGFAIRGEDGGTSLTPKRLVSVSEDQKWMKRGEGDLCLAVGKRELILLYYSRNGHGLSLTDKHIPEFGNQVTLSGHANVFHNPDHDVTANAFLTRSMPTIPQVPNFNTVGGSVDYMYK